MIDDPRITPEYYDLAAVRQIIGVPTSTWHDWQRTRPSRLPRVTYLPYRKRGVVMHEDLEVWIAKRDADRRRTGRTWLRHPLDTGHAPLANAPAKQKKRA